MILYNVYKINDLFIIAENLDQAFELLSNWLKDLKIVKEDIKCIKRIKTESPYPCIVDSLDWEVPLFHN